MELFGYNANYLLSQLLYIISGFCFGIFCRRYGILALQVFKVARRKQGKDLFYIIYLICLALAPLFLWFIAPILLLNRTMAGGYSMFVTIIYFVHRSKQKGVL